MKTSRILIWLVLSGLPLGAAQKYRDETVFLFQNRKVTVAVPEGLGFQSSKNERGIISVRLGDPKNTINLQVSFLPDPEGRFASARDRKEFINETFHEYVAASVEKGMQFEELDPKVGAGTYCVFTDSSLVGKSRLPRGEFLQTTTGLKAWPGVVAVFTVFGNETTSMEYLAVMNMLHEGLADTKYRPCPLLVKYVEAGWLGKKTGRGFYDYSGATPVPTR